MMKDGQWGLALKASIVGLFNLLSIIFRALNIKFNLAEVILWMVISAMVLFCYVAVIFLCTVILSEVLALNWTIVDNILVTLSIGFGIPVALLIRWLVYKAVKVAREDFILNWSEEAKEYKRKNKPKKNELSDDDQIPVSIRDLLDEPREEASMSD